MGGESLREISIWFAILDMYLRLFRILFCLLEIFVVDNFGFICTFKYEYPHGDMVVWLLAYWTSELKVQYSRPILCHCFVSVGKKICSTFPLHLGSNSPSCFILQKLGNTPVTPTV